MQGRYCNDGENCEGCDIVESVYSVTSSVLSSILSMIDCCKYSFYFAEILFITRKVNRAQEKERYEKNMSYDKCTFTRRCKNIL